jgi:hypothetical protein
MSCSAEGLKRWVFVFSVDTADADDSISAFRLD